MGALRSHLRECGTGAQCPLCPKIVTQRRNLRKHMEIHKRYGLYEEDDRMKLMNAVDWIHWIHIMNCDVVLLPKWVRKFYNNIISIFIWNVYGMTFWG